MAAGPQLSGGVVGNGLRRTERSASPPTGPAQRHQGPDGTHQRPWQSGQSRCVYLNVLQPFLYFVSTDFD